MLEQKEAEAEADVESEDAGNKEELERGKEAQNALMSKIRRQLVLNEVLFPIRIWLRSRVISPTICDSPYHEVAQSLPHFFIKNVSTHYPNVQAYSKRIVFAQTSLKFDENFFASSLLVCVT